METKILLTFDLEEFDLPLEFGCQISEEDQINVTNNGLHVLLNLLAKYNISATFFTTSLYAVSNKELLKSLSANHEIASHSKYHSNFKETDLSDSKKDIERIIGKKIYGFRMPRFRKIDLSTIKAAGYRYDSSINPTFIPGRYNNFHIKRNVYLDSGSNLIEIPVSVSPLIRFPLFWLSFKIIPLPIYWFICRITIFKDSYIHLYFHPWEFDDLNSFNIPKYIKSSSGKRYSEKFEKLIVNLLKSGNFYTISEYIESLESI